MDPQERFPDDPAVRTAVLEDRDLLGYRGWYTLGRLGHRFALVVFKLPDWRFETKRGSSY